ncbi:cell division protein SepF [Saccharopolyspora sp. 5N708]|uniref:cell division protein SepF n=1 Tax=Saccharopolyspora sp. 5N708 TaxID=3457424 RepID=UPI003FD0FE36
MVKTVRPKSYSDVYYVGDFFRQGVAVLMDLTSMTNSDATRLVDFAAGLVLGRGGDMDRIAPKVFLLLPPGTVRKNL